MTTVLFVSPSYPSEMPMFVRGLARAGAEVIGVGDQPLDSVAPIARSALAAYWQVPSFGDENGIIETVRGQARGLHIDGVESLWEPTMVLAARLREALGIPGMSVAETIPFRDKEVMKQVLDRAGIRTPHHFSTTTADGIRAAALQVGYPLIIKPIAGAGSADTHRVNDALELDRVIPRLGGVHEVSVEEFIDGEEFTFDSICVDGRVLFENIGWYSPRPLVARSLEWVSPVTYALRDITVPHLAGGRSMGHAVLSALGFRDGFTHMEWYRRADGEVVFGEIAARPPGARTVDVMNFACDTDLFAHWGNATVHGALLHPISRVYNAATVCKRAHGAGRIQRIEGLARLLDDHGDSVVDVDLLPLGAPRRDWRQTLLSDGTVSVRHRDLSTCIEIVERFAAELHLVAG